jgi:PAS domain S-box-containing protein
MDFSGLKFRTLEGRASGLAVGACFATLTVLWGLILLITHWPDQLLLLLAIPVVWSALYYPRSIYVSLTLVLVAASIAVTFKISSSFQASLWTIGVSAVSFLAMLELIHALVTVRRQAEKALEQGYLELAAINTVTTAITATLELDQVLQRLVNSVTALFPQTTAATIQLVDEYKGTLYTEAASANAMPVPEKIVFHPGQGIAGLALAERRTINVADIRIDPRFLPGSAPPPYRSLLVAPLTVGQRVVGTLSLEGKEAAAFEPRDEQLVTALAQQAAIAIENAKLYDETQRRLTETQVLQTVSAAITTLDFDQVLCQAIETLHHSLHIERLSIELPDPETEMMRPRPGCSIGFATGPDGALVNVPMEHSITGQVYRTGESVLLADVSTVPNYYREMPDTRSELCVPLKSGGRVIGVLNAESPRLAAFDKNDQRLFEAVAAQLAVALENARLYEETARRAQEQAIVVNIVRALNASLDIERAFPTVVRGLQELVACERVSLVLADKTHQHFTFVALDSDRTELGRGVTLPRSASAASADLEAGRIHLTPDLAMETDYPGEKALYEAGFHSRVNVPLIAGEQVIGALNLASRHLAAFSPDDLPPLQQIADALAVAIVNSQLHQETRRRLAEVHALAQASTHLTADLELEKTLSAVAQQAQVVLGADRVGVFLFAPQTDSFVWIHAIGLSDEYLRGVERHFQNIPGYRILGKEPVWIEEAQSIDASAPFREVLRREGFSTSVILPLIHRAQVTGGLALYFDQPRRRDPSLLDLAQAFANQAAAALENARLFDRMRTAESQYRGLFESSADPIALLNAEGTFLDVNPAACRVLGRSREEILGQKAFIINPQDETRFREMIWRVLDGETIYYEFSPKIDGQVHHFEAHIERIDYANGLAIQWTAHDVTARRDLDHWREEFTGIIVHNLRNPLTWIKSGVGMAQLLLPERVDPDVIKSLDTANRGIARLEQQIDVLLNIGRAESGHELTDRQPLAPAELVQDVIELLGPRMAAKAIHLQVEMPPTLPGVWGNRNMLAWTLQNLLDNAIKFSPSHETILLGVTAAPDHLCFRVSDRGPGIPPQELERIFQKFYQAQRPVGTQGSGLGLYFSKLAVEAHGGEIWVEHNLDGPGTTFYFNLPMRDKAGSKNGEIEH